LARRVKFSWVRASPLLVLKVVIDVAVDKPGAARVPLLAIALKVGRSKKVETGMVARRRGRV
jgi:hypothetical protein